MGVFRVHKTKNFTVISNYHLKDKALSLKAKGMLDMMLALPDDWDYSVAGLVALCKESKSAVQSALKELEDAGYLVRSRVQDSKGRFNYTYDIYEMPQKNKPNIEPPCTDFLCADNRPQLNTNIQSTKQPNTNKQNIIKPKGLIATGSEKQFGNSSINEMYEIWEEKFGYKPSNSPNNRRAVWNMLRAKDKGKEWIMSLLDILVEAQADKYAGAKVGGISDFADLQHNYSSVLKWQANQKAQSATDNGEYFIDLNKMV